MANETLVVKPNSSSPYVIRASVYRGIGSVRKVIPQGEIQVRSGDVLLELPGGLYALDQLSAFALFGDAIAGLIYQDPDKSQREREDLSSPTHSQSVKDAEKERQAKIKEEMDIDKIRMDLIATAPVFTQSETLPHLKEVPAGSLSAGSSSRNSETEVEPKKQANRK